MIYSTDIFWLSDSSGDVNVEIFLVDYIYCVLLRGRGGGSVVGGQGRYRGSKTVLSSSYQEQFVESNQFLLDCRDLCI